MAGQDSKLRSRPRRPEPDIAADDPQAYIAGDRRRALASGEPMPDRVRGSALFADISGFTPLAEALAGELGPQRGAEELSSILERVFDAVLGELHLHGGTVIFFSGDAVTCWLDGDDGLRALACGLDMQGALARVAQVRTASGRTFELGMKVAVAAGPARRFVVGDPDVQLIDVLAGALMDKVAAAEHHAERGDVVVEASTLANLRDRIELTCLRGDGADEVGVVKALSGLLPPAPAPYPYLPRSVSREWLLPAVYERLRAGRGEFLADLRPAVPMFVRFDGIDYDDDPDAPQMLDDFVRRVQWVVDGHGGNLLQLTVGDKGAYLYAVFGAPLAHEDDPARACAAALDILALEGETAARNLQIGVARGPVRSGTCGHRQRRTYACLGDPVNLAARFMSAAPAGQAYVTAEVARAAGGRFTFEVLSDLKAKGKSKPVAVRRIVGRDEDGPARDPRPAYPLVGRGAELDRLRALASRALEGRGQVVAIEAEAGMGKSRLTAELVHVLREDGVPVHVGAAAAVGSSASYLVWQGIWASLLGVTGVTGAGDRVAALEESLVAVEPDLASRLPLLGAVIGGHLDDNELTASLDPKLRKSALESLLLRYLTVRAGTEPLALVLEDCHWIDPLSADLLELVARATSALPLLVLLTYRPGSFSAPALPHTTAMALPGLDAGASEDLLRVHLAEQFGADTSPPALLVQRLVERSEGNPFFLEELVNYLHDEGIDLSDPKAAGLQLPASLATLVLSRIDTLGESSRRTLKVASVVGRQFAVAVLAGAYPDLGAPRQVTGHLRRLCAEELVVEEDARAEEYAFKHAVIQEVAYESLPFALRALLHGRIGSWLEAARPEGLDLLAHHFWHSSDEEKKIEYLRRAGEAAAARYANDTAIDYYRRLTSLLPEAGQGEIILKIAAVLELRSDWADAEAAYREGLALASASGNEGAAAWALTGLATPLRRQGRYDEAVADLEAASRAFEELGDDAGLGQVAFVRGIIAYQRSNPVEAWDHLQLSLRLRRATGDRQGEARVLDNLAISAAYQEDYDRSRELGEEALALRTTLGDRWGMGVSHANLGVLCFLDKDYAGARGHFEAALAIQLEVGDAYSIANARDNLGNVAREMGEREAAQGHYAAALGAFQALGDRRSLFILYEEIAMLGVASEPIAAFRLLGAAEAMREALGSPRLGAQESELEEHVADARQRLGKEAAEAQGAGRGLAPEDVHRLALRLCGADVPENEELCLADHVR